MPGQIVRHKQTSSYTVIPNALARDFTLSAKARGILVTILSLPEDWDLHVTKLVEWSQEGKEAIYSGIEELITAGYIKRFQERDEMGRKRGMSYAVFDKPFSDYPHPGDPHTDNPPPTKYQESQSTKGDKTAPSSKGEDCRGEIPTSSREGAANA